jgi:hypothetical protein
MEASVRAIHIATVIRLINQQRPLSPIAAPSVLKSAIKEAAATHNTESRRVHRNFVWALDYRGRGAQDRAAMDLVDPATPEFRLKVQRCLSTTDALYVVATLDEVGTVSTKTITPTPKPTEIKVSRTTPNPTAVWLNEQIAKGLIDRLTHTVRNRYPIEDIEDVRSEVHLRIAHWCAKGSFDDHLAEDHPPTISRMAGWVGNRIKSALGRRGQDALWREMRGSRTEVEYRKEEVHPDSLLPSQTYQVGLEGGDDGDPKSVQRVIIDPKSLEDNYSDVTSELSIHEAFKLVIRASRPNAAQRYIRILEGMVAEASRGDIASEDGCSPSRAGKLTARVREDLRHALLYTVSDARKVLRYVVEEPCITYPEIIEDLRMESDDVDRAIRFLTDPEMAYLTETAGRSYKATERGFDAATAPPVGGAAGRLVI